MRVCDKCRDINNVSKIVIKVEDVYEPNSLPKPMEPILTDGICISLTKPRPYTKCEKVLELCEGCKAHFINAMALFITDCL
jgi:hypothetical protein